MRGILVACLLLLAVTHSQTAALPPMDPTHGLLGGVVRVDGGALMASLEESGCVRAGPALVPSQSGCTDLLDFVLHSICNLPVVGDPLECDAFCFDFESYPLAVDARHVSGLSNAGGERIIVARGLGVVRIPGMGSPGIQSPVALGYYGLWLGNSGTCHLADLNDVANHLLDTEERPAKWLADWLGS